MASRAMRRVLNPTASSGNWQNSRRLGQAAQTLTTEDVQACSSATTDRKDYSEMPGPMSIPGLGNVHLYVSKKYRGRWHEGLVDHMFPNKKVIDEKTGAGDEAAQHTKHGKVFRGKLGPMNQVHVCDPSLIEEVLRQQGKFPIRSTFESWKMYRYARGLHMGLSTADGEDWHRIRRIFSRRMMQPKHVHEFGDVMNDVITDLVNRLRSIRDEHSSEKTVPGLPHLLYHWSMESIGTVLFETRLGCLDDAPPSRVQEFISAIDSMMTSSYELIVAPSLHRIIQSKPWRRHMEAWDKIFEIAKYYIDQRLQFMENQMSQGKGIEEFGGVLSHLIAKQNLSMPDIYGNVSELFLAGVDTTSNTLSFIMYNLAKYPRAQDKLRDEVSQVLAGRVATDEDLKQMPYTKQVIKETLRMYPVVPMNVRIIPDEVHLNGYKIPKGTMFVLNHFAAGRDDGNFCKPNEFIPERWSRDADTQRIQPHPFACLPFGHGTRGCVGRRFAEFELALALVRIIQNFELEPNSSFELKPQLRTLLSPGPEVPVIFKER